MSQSNKKQTANQQQTNSKQTTNKQQTSCKYNAIQSNRKPKRKLELEKKGQKVKTKRKGENKIALCINHD